MSDNTGGGLYILRIRQNKEKTRVLLTCRPADDEGEETVYSLGENAYREIGSPLPGEALDAEAEAVLRREDAYYRAMRRALYILSFSDNNERRLRQKLVAAGFSRDLAERVVEETVRLGYVNEERQLERLVAEEANVRLSGPRKLIPKLTAKGYRAEDVRRVLSRLTQEGTIDLRANAKKLVQKRLGADVTPEEKKKLLYRYGYSIC